MTWLRSLSTRVPATKGFLQEPSNTTTLHALPCPELSRLPKAPNVRSIRFKRTNPGSVSHLSFGSAPTVPVLDPSHPIAHLRPKQLIRVVPHHHCSLFEAHAYPQAVLRKFEIPEQMIQFKDKGASNELAEVVTQHTPRPMLPRQSRVLPKKEEEEDVRRSVTVGDHRRAAHTVPMSMMIVASKKPLHKSATIRTKIKLRFKEALSLVTIRGASVDGPEKRIVFGTPEGIPGGENTRTSMILQGWTYVIRPSLEVYRCPWPSLVEHLREGLSSIQSQAMGLEKKWGEASRNPGSRQRSNGYSPHYQPEPIWTQRGKRI